MILILASVVAPEEYSGSGEVLAAAALCDGDVLGGGGLLHPIHTYNPNLNGLDQIHCATDTRNRNGGGNGFRSR